MTSSLGLHPAARRQRHRRIIAPQTAGVDVKGTLQIAAVGGFPPFEATIWIFRASSWRNPIGHARRLGRDSHHDAAGASHECWAATNIPGGTLGAHP